MPNNNYKILNQAVNLNYVAAIDVICRHSMQDFEYHYFNILTRDGTIRVNNYMSIDYGWREIVAHEDFVHLREELINAFMNLSSDAK